MNERSRSWRYELILLAIVAAVFVWSGIRPHDRVTWVLEVFPVVLAVPLLLFTAADSGSPGLSTR